MSEYIVKVSRDGTLYSGSVATPRGSIALADVPYSRIIELLHQEIKDDPEAAVLWARREVQNPEPELLEQWLVDSIKRDPSAAVAAMSPTPVVLDLRDTRPQELAGSILRSGHDILADAFGDWIYIARSEDGKADCPLCGRWHKSLATLDNGATTADVIECNAATRQLALERASDAWFRIKTYLLLRIPVERFFINCRWSWLMGGPWLTAQQLLAKFDRFKKERDNVYPS